MIIGANLSPFVFIARCLEQKYHDVQIIPSEKNKNSTSFLIEKVKGIANFFFFSFCWDLKTPIAVKEKQK